MDKILKSTYLFLKTWRPSLLSLLFLVAGLMLTIRVTNVIHSTFGEKEVSIQIGSEAIAADKKDPATPEEQTKEDGEAKKDTKTKDMPKLKPKKEEDFDPLNLTEGEVKLLFSLNQKKKGLEEKTEKLKEREKLVIVAEQRLDQKIAELKQLKAAIEKIVEIEDEQVQKNTQDLVKMYESMKPKAAAKIFDKLSMSVLMKIVKKMSKKKASPILSAMDVSKVKSLTTLMAQPSKLDLPSVLPTAQTTPTEEPVEGEEES